MAKIDFTPKQIEELKNHYLQELEKLQQRSSEIIGILKNLVHEPVHFEKQIGTSVIKSALPAEESKAVIQTGEKKRRGRPPASTVEPAHPAEELQPPVLTEEKIERGVNRSGNPRWAAFIMQLLKEVGKPLSSEQIIDAYQMQYDLDISTSKPARQSLNQALHQLRVTKRQIISIKRPGRKAKLFALTGTQYIPSEDVQAEKKKKPDKSSGETSKTETKYNWAQFVLNTLAKTKRILSLKEFCNYAIVEYTIPANEKKATYGRISPILTQMVRRKDTIRTVQKDGFHFKYYGLNDWFNSNGELITIYG
jgi:hypothetical protein